MSWGLRMEVGGGVTYTLLPPSDREVPITTPGSPIVLKVDFGENDNNTMLISLWI